MFEIVDKLKQQKFEPSLDVARRMFEHGTSPGEDDGENGARYTALYNLLAIELHLGMPLDETMDEQLAEMSEDDRTVLEDPILRARAVAYACTAMAMDVEQAMRLAHSVFPERTISRLDGEIDNLNDLRFDAAMTIAEGNEEMAHALLPRLSERIPSEGLYPQASKVLV